MEKSRQEIKDTAFALAKKYEMENGNCAQSVFAGVMESLSKLTGEVDTYAYGMCHDHREKDDANT